MIPQVLQNPQNQHAHQVVLNAARTWSNVLPKKVAKQAILFGDVVLTQIVEGHCPLALKPTIFKYRISLSDLNRQYYDSLNLTLAQHHSETTERMMMRVLAYCLNVRDNLEFCKGVSNPEEADLWARDLNDNIELWIDVGEPAVDRIKKATRLAKELKVYSFNNKSDTWWLQGQEFFKQLPAEFFQFEWQQIQALAKLVTRTMEWSITISENSIYVSSEEGDCEVKCLAL